MPNLLVTELADRLSLPHAEVEKQMDRVVETLLEDAVRNNRISVEGFGVFQVEENELLFEPGARLATAANFKYEVHSAIPIRIDGPELTNIGQADGRAFESKSSDVPMALTRRELELTASDQNAGRLSNNQASDSTDETSAPVSDREPVPVSGQPNRMRWGRLAWLVPIVLVGTVLAVVFRPRSVGVPGPPESTKSLETPAPESEMVEPGAEMQNGAALQEDAAASIGKMDKTDSLPAGDIPSIEPTPPPSAAGFQNDFDRSASGYTLIVGSVFSMEDAEREMRRYANMTFPLAILDYQDNGVTRYRLAVGQFESIAAAQEAMETSSRQFPRGTWVRRIR